MSKTFYDFAGLRFTPGYSQIENLETEKKTKLSPIRCQFLLALVENHPQAMSYDDLRRSVWVEQTEISESFKHNVQSTKNGLIKSLKSVKTNTDFVKYKAGEGYFIDAEVEKYPVVLPVIAEKTEQEDIVSVPENAVSVSSDNEKFQQTSDYFGIAAIFCLLYGLLFFIALLLEVAYQFDHYGEKALQIGIPLTVWMSGTALTGLIWVRDFIAARRPNKAFAVGFLFFAGGTLLACATTWFFLPTESVTLAKFQTQPAFAAFIKNSFIYFLPLGVFFILVPFQNIWQKKYGLHSEYFIKLQPVHLVLIWTVALLYSIISTFYLLDNLLPDEFHGFFVFLVFTRFFVYFGLALACLLWYRKLLYSDLNNEPSKNPKHGFFWYRAVSASLFLCAFSLFFTAMENPNRTPQLQGIEAVSEIKGGKQFFVRLRGENFDSEKVFVKVVGDGCPELTPCSVPNSALKKHSAIEKNKIENVPMTLAQGSFLIYAQNGNSPVSNSIVLDVP